jgi:Tfp pilus assembly protein PilF
MKQVFVAILFVGICLSTAGFAQTEAVDPELVRLRHDCAMRFFDPGPHMKLAKYFRDKGNLIQAFYILENARRGRFDQKVFDDAFLLHFGGFRPLGNSKAEEEKYLNLRKTSPNDIEATRHLADIYISRDDFVRAEPLLILILQKNPEDFGSVAALAEIYERQQTVDKSKQILDDFERRFPGAAGSYDMRIQRAMSTDVSHAKSLLAEAIKKYPEDGHFLYHLALIAERENKLDEAELNYIKAADLEKTAVSIQGAAARFFRNKKKDAQRALGYYLNAYLLDPHSHFDGFAEARIAGLSIAVSKAQVEKQLASGKRAEELVDDPNPMVVVMALEKVAEKWDRRALDLFLRMIRHDEVMVRWTAMQVITQKEGRAFDTRLRELLKDDDLRVRGLAAYMAVHLWKADSFPEMRKLLTEKAEVLRFDAASALIMQGGAEGLKIVKEHRQREPSEYLKKLIDRN